MRIGVSVWRRRPGGVVANSVPSSRRRVGGATLSFVLLLLALPLSAAEPFVVHVSVALCDNASQGIVPVPAAIGDGNAPRTNLYWGASLGVKTWLKCGVRGARRLFATR